MDEQQALQPQLDRLNKLLDEMLDFKESLTPEKKAKIEGQLERVKEDVKGFSNIPAREIKKQFLKLSESLITLVNLIMESSPPRQI